MMRDEDLNLTQQESSSANLLLENILDNSKAKSNLKHQRTLRGTYLL